MLSSFLTIMFYLEVIGMLGDILLHSRTVVERSFSISWCGSSLFKSDIGSSSGSSSDRSSSVRRI